MRLLVYGMQSSGATAFSLFLAQKPGSLGLVDILNNYAAPKLECDLPVIAKVVVTTAYPLETHQERFRPDRTILFLRDPRENYVSLMSKGYRNHSGLIDEKFALLDRIFGARDRFDAVIYYEDFIDRAPHILRTVNDLKWPVDEACYAFRRTHVQLIKALWEAVPDLFNHFEFSYGNVQSSEVSKRFNLKEIPKDVEDRLSGLCPNILDHYRRRGTQRHKLGIFS
jgi:hypothetical protein